MDYADSEWVDNVAGWKDEEGNYHEGMWDRDERDFVDGVIFQLSDEQAEDRGREYGAYVEYHGLVFSDEYTLDDFVEDVEDDSDHYE